MRKLIGLMILGLLLTFVQAASANSFDDGIAAGKRGDYAISYEIYLPLAEQGHSGAQNNLGSMYYDGLGLAQDYQQAMMWYRKAADQGQRNAQTSVGWLFDQGLGVSVDFGEALKWFRLSSEQGFGRAHDNLGRMYREGRGVAHDPVRALMWYEIAHITLDGSDPVRADTEKGIEELRAVLSADEIARAFALAECCINADFKFCGYPVKLPAIGSDDIDFLCDQLSANSEGRTLNPHFPDAAQICGGLSAIQLS